MHIEPAQPMHLTMGFALRRGKIRIILEAAMARHDFLLDGLPAWTG
jgi:hypothetical protein